eukprot:s4758_g1.t1
MRPCNHSSAGVFAPQTLLNPPPLLPATELELKACLLGLAFERPGSLGSRPSLRCR